MKRIIYFFNIVMISFSVLFINRKAYKNFMVFLSFFIAINMRFWEKYRKHMNAIIPNFLCDLKRNYNVLELGVLDKYNKDNSENALKLMNYRRNLYTDILLIKRYYSLLRKGGEVKIYFGKKKEYYNTKSISIFDYSLLHPVTIYEHSFIMYIYVIKMKEIFSGIFFLISSKEQKKDFIKKEIINDALSCLNEIAEFLEVRGLKLQIELSDEQIYKKIKEMENKLYKNVTMRYVEETI